MDIAESYGATVLLAWEGKQDFAELIDYTAKLESAGLAPLSALLYQTWLNRNQSPYAHAVNFNLGATLSNLGDLAGAEAAYRRAIAMAPAFAQPRLNLGLLFERSGQVDAAIDEWKWIVGNCCLLYTSPSPRDS